MDWAYAIAFIGGLLVFFVPHYFTASRRQLREQMVEVLGPGPYKGLYSLLTGVGFVAMVWGYAMLKPWITLGAPPTFMRHIAMLLMLPAIILIVAAYVRPSGFIRKAAKHPMLLAVKLWAFAHLLVNWDVGSLLLFGSFLVYGIVDRILVKRRGDMGAATVTPNVLGDLISIAVGLALYGILVYELHYVLFGVDPMG